jgi:outer membrane lipoprotein-sorting protein
MRRRTKRTKSARIDGTQDGRPFARKAAIALAAFLSVCSFAHPGWCAAEEGAASQAAGRDAGAEAPGAGTRDDASTATLDEAVRLVQEIVERYESARSCRLDFEQSNYWALADSTATTSGVLVLQRPSKVSVRYDDGGRIVVRGDTVRVYVPSTRQLFIAPVDSSDVVIDPARLLKSYRPDTARPFLPPGVGSPDTKRLNLRPRDTGLEPTRLEALVNTRTKLIQRLTILWTTGDSVVYAVRETLFDVPIDDREFIIRRPPGVKLVREMP